MNYNTVEINKKNLLNNLKILKSIKNNKICMTIKANAYSHDIVKISKIAQLSKIVSYLGVYSIEEAIILRKNNINLPILIYGFINEDFKEKLISYNLEIFISSKKQLISLLNKDEYKLKIHIMVNTGLNREGIDKKDLEDLIDFAKEKAFIKGLASHFIASEKSSFLGTNNKQIEIFKECIAILKSKDIKDFETHIDNSEGIINYKDIFTMSRPGLACYGYGSLLKLKPVLELKSTIVFIKEIEANQGVSYHHSYISKGKTLLGIVPFGYADGINKSLENNLKVLINDKEYEQVGDICMNQMMICIDKSIKIGDKVTIISNSKLGDSAKTIALKTNNCIYEVLTSIKNHIPRIII